MSTLRKWLDTVGFVLAAMLTSLAAFAVWLWLAVVILRAMDVL